jgi:hypothetical protein
LHPPMWGSDFPAARFFRPCWTCTPIPGHLLDQVCVIVDKLGRPSRDEIQRELFSTGLLSEAVQAIIQVLSLKSLTELEACFEEARSCWGEKRWPRTLFLWGCCLCFLCVGCNLELCLRRSRKYVVKKCVRWLGQATISRSIFLVKKNYLLF